MDKKTLVNSDLEEGKKLLELLDKSELKITSAFWFYFSKTEEWRLVLATILIEEDGPKKAYTKLNNFIKEHIREVNITLEAIIMISPKDPLNNLLRMAIKTGPVISGIRFSGNVINGTLIQDSYLYRVN